MSEKIGLGRNAWQTYELGKSSPGTNVYADLIAMGFSADWIIAGIGDMVVSSGKPPHQTNRPFDIVDALASAGIGDTSCCMSVLVAQSDSMSPTISAGDLVVIKNTNGIIDGDGIYVLGGDGGACSLKRMQWLFDGTYRMISDNPVYPIQMIGPGELERVHVAGKVVWHGRRV